MPIYIYYNSIYAYILVYTLMYFLTVSRTQLLLFHLISTALRRIVLMLTWRTVGMHVPSSFSSAICVQRMQESQRTAPAKLVQVYTCIYMYIRVYLGFTCISWVVCQLRQLKIECNFVQAHRHESQARGVETLRRHKAQPK